MSRGQCQRIGPWERNELDVWKEAGQEKEATNGERLTQNTTLLLLIQHPLGVDASLQITLCDLTQLVIFEGHLSHKLEVVFEAFHPPSLATVVEVIIKLHPGLSDFVAGTDSETTHAAAVQVQSTDGVKEQKQAVVRLGRVGNVSTVGAVVVHLVEGGRVLDAEAAVGVLAVQALLVPVDHGLPVEAARVLDGATVRETAEVVAGQQVQERRGEPLRKGWCRGVDGGEEEAGWCEVMV